MSRDAVVNILNLYSAALDSHGWDLFDDVFTPDVEADYPPEPWHWFDLASFRRDFIAYHEPLGSHQHSLTNQHVLLNGDEAFALSYGRYSLFQSAANGGRMNEGGCWYDDHLIRTPAGWRIRKRTARVFWHRPASPPGEPMPEAVFASSLPEEARAGRVGFYNALRQQRVQGTSA